MTVFPYKTIYFKSDLSRIGFNQKLKNVVEVNKKLYYHNIWWHNLYKRKQRAYVGYLKDDFFYLKPLLKYSRTEFLSIKGCLIELNNSSIIKLEFKLPLLTLIFFTAISLFGFGLFYINYKFSLLTGHDWIGFELVIAITLLVYLIVLLSFFYQ